MKILNVAFVLVLLSGCTTTAVKLDKDLNEKNQAIIKDSVFVPAFSPNSSTLVKIDGKDTDYTSHSNIIEAGKHELVFRSSCKGLIFTKYYNRFVVTVRTDNITLVKGHTYKISPVLGQHTKTKDYVCLTKFEDLTKPIQ